MDNRIRVLVLITLYATHSMYAADHKQQLAAIQYIQNTTNKAGNILTDDNLISMIQRRQRDTQNWINSALKEYTKSDLEKSAIHVNTVVNNIVKQIELFSNAFANNQKPSANILSTLKNSSKTFSTDAQELKKEIATLQKMKSRKFPPVSSAKKQILEVVIAYADLFAFLAQRAITDFSNLDAVLLIQGQKEAAAQFREKQKPIVQKKLEDLYTEFGVTGDEYTSTSGLPVDEERYAPVVLPALRDIKEPKKSDLLRDTGLETIQFGDQVDYGTPIQPR